MLKMLNKMGSNNDNVNNLYTIVEDNSNFKLVEKKL